MDLKVNKHERASKDDGKSDSRSQALFGCGRRCKALRRHRQSEEAMSKERGFYDLDFTGLFIGIAVVAVIIGFLLYPTLGWLWSIIKPWIHGVTA